jgi:hypothetical protein
LCGASGQNVLEEKLIADGNGNIKQKLIFNNRLPAGFYYLKAGACLKITIIN